MTAAQKQVRVDVFDFVSGQFRDAFFLPKRDWAREQGIVQCGHLGGEDVTLGAVQYGYGSVMRQLRAMDMPGVDAIWRQIFPGQETENNFPKFASSVAHQNGTALSFTESYRRLRQRSDARPDEMGDRLSVRPRHQSPAQQQLSDHHARTTR